MSKSKGCRVAIVAADFNREVIDAMIVAVGSEAEALGALVVHTVRVPGCYELPFATDLALTRIQCDALVVLGYIERGETLHGEVMGQVVMRTLVELGIQYDKPIGLGIIGPGATLEQAHERKDGAARAALQAALAVWRLQTNLPEG
jgi:6,7-dimethyl-8-ribityllumazine synthase